MQQKKLNDGLKWCQDNKEIIVVGVPIIVATITAATKLGSKALGIFKEKHFRDRYFYDRSLGCYLKLRRTLSNHEMVAIERRRQAGERLIDILNDMRVLK